MVVDSVPEIVLSVVVATQVGTPATNARTCPLAPAEVVAIGFVPLPSKTVLATKFTCPVPPLGTVFVKDEPPRQIPFTEKHPLVKLIPFAKVEDAVVDLTSRRFVEIPPAKVDVAVVVPVKKEPTISPTTESGAYGLVVPIPILPL